MTSPATENVYDVIVIGTASIGAEHGGGVAPLGHDRGRRPGSHRAALARRPLLPVHQRSMAPPP